jgi:hypothetical protein
LPHLRQLFRTESEYLSNSRLNLGESVVGMNLRGE